MCVAIIKPTGVQVPSMEVLEKCWNANPDGAGFAFHENGMIRIVKGLMTFSAFKNEWNSYDMDNYSGMMFIHFRIGTHGGNTPGNTHPFPITNDIQEMKKVDNVCDRVLMHNGTIDTVFAPSSRDISDTMEFTKRLAELGDVNYSKVFEMLRDVLYGQKIAIMDKNGGLFATGPWECEDGVYYSNMFWKAPRMVFRNKCALNPDVWDGCFDEDSEKLYLVNNDKNLCKKLEKVAREYYGDDTYFSFEAINETYILYEDWRWTYEGFEYIPKFSAKIASLIDDFRAEYGGKFNVDEFDGYYRELAGRKGKRKVE